MTVWSIYMIRDQSGSLYTGISVDVLRRFKEHCSRTAKAAKYTKARKELKLVYSCELGNRSLASKAEYRVKRLAKREKEFIVEQKFNTAELIKKLTI